MRNARLLSVLLAVATLTILAGAVQAADDEGFRPLFNGRDFTGFDYILGSEKGEDPAKTQTFRVEDGAIICTGKPNGYFFTEKSFKNYTLKFEVRYARPSGLQDDAAFKGNSGFLIHIQGEHKIWPKSVEVQGMNADLGNIFAIGGAAKGTFKKEAAVQKAAIKPVGQWNTVEILCQDGKICSKINGQLVCEGTSELMEGPLGFQSEGAEIHFRKIMIKEAR